MIWRILAAISLLLCLAAPFLYFWGLVSEGIFKGMLAAFSAAWFIFATAAMAKRPAHRP